VKAVRMAQARRADLAVDERVVDGMEHAVAHARDDGEERHRPIVGAECKTERRGAQ
jgi:hypothetical protein